MFRDSAEFVESVKNHLDAGEHATALEILSGFNNSQYIKNGCWDLIPKLCKNLTKDVKKTDEKPYSCSQQMLEILAKNAEPEELVLEFLEQLDEPDDIKFPVILSLLKIILLRDLSNRKNSLEWCLNSIRSYLEQTQKLELDGGKSLEESCNHNLEESLKVALLFYDQFISLYILNRSPDKETEIIKVLLVSRLIQLCDVGLPYVDFKVVTDFREIHSQIIDLTLKLISNPFTLLEHVFYRSLNLAKPKEKSAVIKKSNDCNLRELDDDDFAVIDEHLHQSPFVDDNIISDLSYGMFFYSLLFQNDEESAIINCLPLVYSSKFMFLSLSFVTVPFFKKSHDIAVKKGLDLLKFLLDRLHDKELTKSDLYFPHHKTLLIHLNNVMVYSEVKENRCSALKCFNSYISCFDWEARYWLLFNFRKHVHHSGTIGYMITMLKDFLSEFLNLSAESTPVKEFSRYYKGKLLFDMIKKYCFLTEDKATDLIENADHIISSLNFLRFLVIRDKNNITDVKLFIKEIHKDFLMPLKECVTNSKNDYEVRQRNIDLKKDDSSNIEISVKNSLLPKLSKEEERNACMLALNAIDVIDSLLSRVLECILEFHFCSARHLNQLRFFSTAKDEFIEDSNAKGKHFIDHEYEENIKEKILGASLPFVKEFGWSKAAISNGAESVGYPGVTSGIFSNSEADLIYFFNKKCNQELFKHMEINSLHNSSKPEPKEFIQEAVKKRLGMVVPYIDHWPQALGIMSLPPNVPRFLKNFLFLIDDICYHSGDKSVDFSWYSRRLAVSGIYKATELCLIQDKSQEYKDTWEFLNRRTEQVFQARDFLKNGVEVTATTGDIFLATLSTARSILRLNRP